MAQTLNTTTLITNAGAFGQFDEHRLKRLKILALAASNAIHCSGTTYHLSQGGWRNLSAAADTALLGATPKQCEQAIIQLQMESGSLCTAATPMTDSQMRSALQFADLLYSMPDDQLDRMYMYLLGVQSSTVSAL